MYYYTPSWKFHLDVDILNWSNNKFKGLLIEGGSDKLRNPSILSIIIIDYIIHIIDPGSNKNFL